MTGVIVGLVDDTIVDGNSGTDTVVPDKQSSQTAASDLSLGLRLASQTYAFDSGDDQAHRMVGLFFTYDYRYGF